MATKARLLAEGRDFLRWWRHELAQLLPGHERGEEDVVLEASSVDGQARLGLDGTEIALSQPPPEALRRRLATTGGVVLRLGEGLVLHHPVTLPAAAEEDLSQVLRFEMDRQTPFRPDAVYFDHALLERRSGQLRVALAVAPRRAVDPFLEWLDQADVTVQRMPVHCDGIDLDLLPADRQRRRVDWVVWSRRALAGTALALGLGVLALPAYQDRARLVQLEPAVAAARADALATQRLREEIEMRAAAAAFASRQKREGIDALDVLAEVTARLGDDSWLQEFELQGGEVRLRGEGPNAALLIDELDGSARFANPRFRAPVTQGTTAEQERFYLSAEVTP